MQVNRFITQALLCFGVMLTGCADRLSPEAYMSWVKNTESGFVQEHVVNEYRVEAFFKPDGYQYLTQPSNPNQQDAYDAYMNSGGSDMIMLDLKIGRQDQEDLIETGALSKAEIQQRIYYYAYTFKDHIYLEKDGEQLPCAMLHFERSFDLKGYRNFLLGFEPLNDDTQLPFTLVIHSELLATGPIKLYFEERPDRKLRFENPKNT